MKPVFLFAYPNCKRNQTNAHFAYPDGKRNATNVLLRILMANVIKNNVFVVIRAYSDSKCNKTNVFCFAYSGLFG